jgi:hypothetical protein
MNEFDLQLDLRPSYVAEHYWPIRALWARVLVKAICDFVVFKEAKTLKGRREFKKVEQWLFGEDTGFLSVCEAVGWSPLRIRAKATTMTKDEVRKIEHRDRDPVMSLRGSSSNGHRG